MKAGQLLFHHLMHFYRALSPRGHDRTGTVTKNIHPVFSVHSSFWESIMSDEDGAGGYCSA